jgi:hypothetical protein
MRRTRAGEKNVFSASAMGRLRGSSGAHPSVAAGRLFVTRGRRAHPSPLDEARPRMFVKQLWRYPVKSMGGEELDPCEITPDGIPGDRVVHVENGQGKVVTSRSRPRLLLSRVRLGEEGEPLVDERPWGDPSVAADVRAAAGETAIANCRTTVDLLGALVDGALSAEEDAALAAHFAACPRCVEFLASYRGTSRIIREVMKVDVPADIEERLFEFLASRRR